MKVGPGQIGYLRGRRSLAGPGQSPTKGRQNGQKSRPILTDFSKIDRFLSKKIVQFYQKAIKIESIFDPILKIDFCPSQSLKGPSHSSGNQFDSRSHINPPEEIRRVLRGSSRILEKSLKKIPSKTTNFDLQN